MPRRMERVNELLRQRLSALLQREVKDPRLSGIISVTSVETSPDLRQAKVYISVLGSAPEREAALQGFRAAANFLRRTLAEDISLRRVPELVFLPDASAEQGETMAGLLRQIRESTPRDG